jgi:flagellar biogenesis protein FliO
MRQFVEDMRARPKEERVAFATSVAIGTVLVLFLIWGFFLLRKIKQNAPVLPETQEVPLFEATTVGVMDTQQEGVQ